MAASVRSKPPFRADHVGSLLRPKNLFEARAKWSEGDLPKAELTKIEDECIREAVSLQEEIGFKGVFGPGTNTNDIIEFVRNNAPQRV